MYKDDSFNAPLIRCFILHGYAFSDEMNVRILFHNVCCLFSQRAVCKFINTTMLL